MRTFGYRLGKRIGEGSYSKVYYAKQVSLRSNNAHANKAIACKVIDSRYTSGEYMNKFLPRELEIIKSLSHPNIVSVYSILEVGPFICCFMDFCAFGDLLDRIRYRGPLTTNECKLYFSQLVSAVHYLHREAISHRDIKCENVLIHNRYTVKLTDFGFSRPLVTSHGQIELSETFCGSAAYAAPEVLKGIAYDPRLYDMWSLGCVLFIMCTGSMPFDDDNITVTIRRQERHQIVYPPDAAVNVNISAIIEQLLDPDVASRLSAAKLFTNHWLFDRKYSSK